MQKIGHSLPAGTEGFRWHNLSTGEGTEYVYDGNTGMVYEYADELGILAISHDVGLVTYYRATADEFDSLMIDTGNAGPAPCRECDSTTHREDAHG